MIKYTKGDITRSDVDAIVNTVNTVGVMGKCIALSFKKAFPENYKQYRQACDHGEVRVGKMFVTTTGRLMPRCIQVLYGRHQ
jgi:O-acetyl-ADP-ribose deacetylase (regulator of RNase III)